MRISGPKIKIIPGTVPLLPSYLHSLQAVECVSLGISSEKQPPELCDSIK